MNSLYSMDIKVDYKDFHGKLKKWNDKMIPTKNAQVGIFNELSKIASIHEFGATIKPKKSKWLTIPASKESKGKKATSFNDLFFIKSKKKDTALLLQKKTNIIFYILKKEIIIPDRRFMRSTINDDQVRKRVYKLASGWIQKIIDGKENMDKYLEMIALGYSMEMKNRIYNGLQPKNSTLTLSLKNTNKPLIDTRRLVDSITHRLV
jgi:hypothetical protein